MIAAPVEPVFRTCVAPCGCRGGAAAAARPDNVAAPPLLPAALTTTTGECAEDTARGAGAPCASRRVLDSIAQFIVARRAPPDAPPPESKPGGLGAEPPESKPGGLGAEPPELLPTAASADAAAVRRAAALLGCASESCVLASAAFRQHAGLGEAALARELEVRFKAAGPRRGAALLSNYDIDGVLRRWGRVFPFFYHCPFAMMDFDRTQEPFAALDLADVLTGRAPADPERDRGPARGRPATCFGCVVNTDPSSRPGKHWVAVFVDCRGGGDRSPRGEKSPPWTVEYFDSAGGRVPRAMAAWQERSRARLAQHRGGAGEVVTVATTVTHQHSKTECGLYALYYIRRRLEGTPCAEFAEGGRISDAAMTAFRAHVFRAT